SIVLAQILLGIHVEACNAKNFTGRNRYEDQPHLKGNSVTFIAGGLAASMNFFGFVSLVANALLPGRQFGILGWGLEAAAGSFAMLYVLTKCYIYREHAQRVCCPREPQAVI